MYIIIVCTISRHPFSIGTGNVCAMQRKSGFPLVIFNINFASKILCQKDASTHDEELARVLDFYTYYVCPLDGERKMTSIVFEMILRGASRTAIAKAFGEAGKSVILLLVDIVQPPMEHCHPAVAGRILLITCYFSRVLTAMVPIAYYPGMSDTLIFHLKRLKTSLSKEVFFIKQMVTLM
jgi:hypothetical protein